MATDAQDALNTLADWIRQIDAHASHRLPLIEEAQRTLANSNQVGRSPDQRRALAARLERWRYQHLNERNAQFSPEDRRLADALDLVANELSGRQPRAPRAVRWLIHDPSRDGDLAEATACLDPAVELPEVVRRAAAITSRHFGALGGDSPGAARRRMSLYAPLYLSSHCINHCTYCGFRFPQQIQRKHLTVEEALREADVLRTRGFRHILLVAGDFPSLTSVAYYSEIIGALCSRGIHPTIEIAPQSTDAYAELAAAGARGVTLYQETYAEALYGLYHPRGTKASFDWRLEGLDRAAEAGLRRLGLGFLLGLADPRDDLLAMLRHARYLQSRFPDRTLAFSLPRIREAPDGFQSPHAIDDDLFLRLYCVLRIAFPKAELVLSTRESAALRNHLAAICITQMSAGSCTTPGGYEDTVAAEAFGSQFPVSDHRSSVEVADWLRTAGFAVTWDLA